LIEQVHCETGQDSDVEMIEGLDDTRARHHLTDHLAGQPTIAWVLTATR